MGSLTGCLIAVLAVAQGTRPPFVLLVHGGAGGIQRGDLTPREDSAYRAALTAALRRGVDVLERGGASLDAVTAVITTLEDDARFNAGKGAVRTNAGTVELDASIMDGNTLRAGAVAGVQHIRNPILLARVVMDSSPHVMLAGVGAEAFAAQHGMSLVPDSYFESGRRQPPRATPQPHGTVGAVALDRAGHLAAGTSTGGTANKAPGRIGDSPIIGAGTYANATCAVSATGVGEFFIRNVVAHDLCARVEYRGESIEQAATEVVMGELVTQGGAGGVIVLDAAGHSTATFNTTAMLRGSVRPDGRVVVKIYRDE